MATHVDLQDSVVLESGILLPARDHGDGVADNAVADGKPAHVGPNGDHFAGDVLAQHRRVLEREKCHVLQVAVDGVDGYNVVLDEYLIVLRCPCRRGLHLIRVRLGKVEECSGVGNHGVSCGDL